MLDFSTLVAPKALLLFVGIVLGTGCDATPSATFEGDAADAAGVDAPVLRDVSSDVAETASPCGAPTGVNAGCCDGQVAPCVGAACQHCTDCASAGCPSSEFCCGHMAGPTYKAMCQSDPTACK